MVSSIRYAIERAWRENEREGESAIACFKSFDLISASLDALLPFPCIFPTFRTRFPAHIPRRRLNVTQRHAKGLCASAIEREAAVAPFPTRPRA